MLQAGFHPIPPGKVAAIVTHLEMTAPPPTKPVTLPEGATLRQVAAPTLAWYRDLFTRVGARDWMWFSRLRMDDATLEATITDPAVEVHAVERQGRAEGLLELDFREDGSCELAFLGLTAGAQGLGLGRAMMTTAITRAFARPIARLHIHTCTFDSPTALPFYLRSGFVPVRREVEVVDDPRLDGTLPPDAAPQVPVIR